MTVTSVQLEGRADSSYSIPPLVYCSIVAYGSVSCYPPSYLRVQHCVYLSNLFFLVLDCGEFTTINFIIVIIIVINALW